jgi:uncharacterized RDD family membrane protein YckC
MEYEDTIAIETPEGIALDLPLAGLGSRFAAALADALIQGTIIAAAAVAVFGSGLPAATAIFLIVLLFVLFGYDILFEVLASGRTPGKRWTGTRVVRTGGHPVGFLTSAVRNLMRVVDVLPFAYGVGCAAILSSPLNQRLGDIAAGTVVVRERGATALRSREPPGAGAAPRLAAVPWDVSAVGPAELAAVRGFLERRSGLAPEVRARLARSLAERLRPLVPGAPAGGDDEEFLESLAAAKAARG